MSISFLLLIASLVCAIIAIIQGKARGLVAWGLILCVLSILLSGVAIHR